MSNYSLSLITNLHFQHKSNEYKINFLITQYKATIGPIGKNRLTYAINIQWLLHTVMIINHQKKKKKKDICHEYLF